ncbi:MAG: DNA-binding protein WhiA [Bacilli bacterium]|nr:DNA-binding protein WhiA [Bacilli bacterium]
MSFTSTVKNEVSKLETIETERITELSAIIKNIGIIDNSIKIVSENASVARRIFNLIKSTYYISPKITVRRGYNFNKNYIYLLEIDKKIELIKQDLSLDSNVPKEYIYNDDDLMRSYLRGLFLSVGSINDPKKSRYHLEFLVNNIEYANFISYLLNQFELNSKVLKRENKFMIYIKEAEKIGDFLRIIRAISAVFYYEDIRIYRDHKNMTNRLNNCEQANVDKIIETATNQIRDIEIIKTIGGLDLLDEKTKEAAIYRLKYPESSLTELSEIITIETNKLITKSGLYHRFKKIQLLANKINNNNQ